MRGKIAGPVVEAAEHGLKCLSIFRSVFVTCPQSNVHHRTLSGLFTLLRKPPMPQFFAGTINNLDQPARPIVVCPVLTVAWSKPRYRKWQTRRLEGPVLVR